MIESIRTRSYLTSCYRFSPLAYNTAQLRTRLVLAMLEISRQLLCEGGQKSHFVFLAAEALEITPARLVHGI